MTQTPATSTRQARLIALPPLDSPEQAERCRRDLSISRERAARMLNDIPELNRLAQAHWNSPASFNLGSLMLLLARARLRVLGDPILEITHGLQSLLGASDLAEGLPAPSFARLTHRSTSPSRVPVRSRSITGPPGYMRWRAPMSAAMRSSRIS
ncbi:MAG: hypothetical protein EOM91_16510 [Sphingobacteriia bacterium]|nr:hypothetical protein [Sphingobacteriia bacterium]NCC41211.1 hypothetical protein [Gammaproteobacteria bacterium]